MRLTRTIRKAAVVAVAMALVGTGAALAVTGSVKTYTGCLTTSGGTLTLIKEGNSPQKPCPAGSVVARFSEGDITAITASTGLRGSATSGDVTLDIAPSYRLPQDCAAGKIAKWDGSLWQCADDANSTYTAGTGLDLTGSEFSIEAAYRLPTSAAAGDSVIKTSGGTWVAQRYAKAGQACTSGQFVEGVTSTGGLDCAAPPAAAAGQYVSTQVEDVGIPDDDNLHVIGSLNPGAGTYFIIAKAVVFSDQNVDQFRGLTCLLVVDGVVRDEVRLTDDTLNAVHEIPLALTTVMPVTNGFSLQCQANDGADGLRLFDVKLIGLKI